MIDLISSERFIILNAVLNMLNLKLQALSVDQDNQDTVKTVSSLPNITVNSLHKHLSEKIPTPCSTKDKEVGIPDLDENGPPGSEPTRSSSFTQDGTTPHQG